MRIQLLFTVAAMSLATPALAQVGTPIAAAKAADPAALSIARQITARLIPAGTYKQVMSTAMDAVADNLGASMKALPLRQLAEMGGLEPAQAAKLDKVDLGAVMAIVDPHWEERTQLSMRAMFTAMGDFFTTFEPDLRESLAHAYANKYSVRELREIDGFFSTPTGAKYAAQTMTIMTDPAVMQATKAMMPKMMQQMPQFITAAQKATAGLPPPRKMQDLSEAEKAKIAKALGIDPSKLRDPKSAT